MDVFLFALYYITLIFMMVIYLYTREKGRFSIADGIVSSTLALLLLGGFFNSFGYRYGLNELNIRIFFDYYIFMVIMPTGLLLGTKIPLRSRIHNTLDFHISRNSINLLLLFIVIYGGAYLYLIKDSVPLFLLISGKTSTFAELAIKRVSITHNYEANFSIPYLLRFYRLVINDMMKFVLVIVFLHFLEKPSANKLQFAFTLVLAIIFHTYSFEKSGLIYLFLLISLAYMTYKQISFKVNKKMYIIITIISIFLLVSMYMVFMGAGSPGEAIERVFDRAVIGQTSGVYYQDFILQEKYNGNLWGKGVTTFLLDSLLNRKTIDLSAEAYNVLYPQYASKGAVGTTGGMPMFFLRSNFGYVLGTIILFAFSLVAGLTDNIFRRVTRGKNKNIISIALYSVLVIYFVQAFISNFTRVFMLPFGISPQIIVILLTVIFLKYSGYTLVKK